MALVRRSRTHTLPVPETGEVHVVVSEGTRRMAQSPEHGDRNYAEEYDKLSLEIARNQAARRELKFKMRELREAISRKLGLPNWALGKQVEPTIQALKSEHMTLRIKYDELLVERMAIAAKARRQRGLDRTHLYASDGRMNTDVALAIIIQEIGTIRMSLLDLDKRLKTIEAQREVACG